MKKQIVFWHVVGMLLCAAFIFLTLVFLMLPTFVMKWGAMGFACLSLAGAWAVARHVIELTKGHQRMLELCKKETSVPLWPDGNGGWRTTPPKPSWDIDVTD
jgi:hypothetical protein